MKDKGIKTDGISGYADSSLTRLVRQYIPRLPSLFINGLRYRMAGRRYTPRPTRLSFAVTHRCNAKCIMCPIWRKGDSGDELTVSEIREVVSNPLFDSLERFAFTGGEPTLREDIAGVAGIILDSRPKVERFGITTNGIEPSRVSRQIKNLLEVINGRAVQFTVAVSLDGYGDTHGKVRGVPGAFDRVNETIRLLNELRRQSPFNMYLNCVVQPMNIGELPRLREYARGMGLYLQVTPVYMHSVITEDENSKQKLEMNREQMAELEMFVTNPENGISPMWASFWEDYFRVIRGEKRKIPCALLNHGITLDADGTMYVCGTDEAMEYGNVRHAPVDRIWYSDEAKMMRENVKKEYCTYCTNACYLTFSYRYDFLYYARFLLKEEAGKLLRRG